MSYAKALLSFHSISLSFSLSLSIYDFAILSLSRFLYLFQSHYHITCCEFLPYKLPNQFFIYSLYWNGTFAFTLQIFGYFHNPIILSLNLFIAYICIHLIKCSHSSLTVMFHAIVRNMPGLRCHSTMHESRFNICGAMVCICVCDNIVQIFE